MPSPCSKTWAVRSRPIDWQGGLPITYHLGGEQARVHLKIEMDNSIKPYYVVEGRIRGSELPDEWVVMGNHRDAWVFGGVDPSSGTASMMEMTRALGQLLKQGIRPRRTLVVCSWDGEEVGLTGRPNGASSSPRVAQEGGRLHQCGLFHLRTNFDGSAVGFARADAGRDQPISAGSSSGKSLYEAWKQSSLARRRRKMRENQSRERQARSPTPIWSTRASAAVPTTPCSSISSACP